MKEAAFVGGLQLTRNAKSVSAIVNADSETALATMNRSLFIGGRSAHLWTM